MLEPNLIKMQSMARDMSDEQLTARLQQNQTNPDPYDYLFASELMQRGKQRASAAAPQEPTQTVRDDVVQNAAGLAGLGAPPSLPVEGPPPAASPDMDMMAAGPEMIPETAMMAEGGLAGLDTSPDMFNQRYYANGGIVSFADGGETDPYWAEMERSHPEREYYLTGPAKYLWNQAGRNIYDIGALPATFLEGWSYVKDPKTGKLVRKSSQEDFRYFPKSYEGYEQFFGKDQPARREKMTEAELERNPPEPEKRNLRTKYLAGRPSMTAAATAPMEREEAAPSVLPESSAAAGLAALMGQPDDYNSFDKLYKLAGEAPPAYQEELPDVGTESDYMSNIARSRKAAGVDVAGREAQQAAKIKEEQEKLTAGKKRDLWSEAAMGFLELAQTPGTLGQGLAAGGKRFLEGAKEVQARVREDEKDLARRQEAQEEMQFARKLGDADAVMRAKEKDEDARLAAANRNGQLLYSRDADIFKMKYDVLGARAKEESANARSRRESGERLALYQMEAEKDANAAAAALTLESRKALMQHTAKLLEGTSISMEEYNALISSIGTDHKEEIDNFVAEHEDGYTDPDTKKFIPPEEVRSYAVNTMANSVIGRFYAAARGAMTFNQLQLMEAGGMGVDPRFQVEKQ